MRAKVGQLRRFCRSASVVVLQETHGDEHEIERILNLFKADWKWHFNAGVNRNQGGTMIMARCEIVRPE